MWYNKDMNLESSRAEGRTHLYHLPVNIIIIIININNIYEL